MTVLAFAKNKTAGRMYFQNFLGNIHKNPSKDSTSLTVVQCSHSVKLLATSAKIEGWSYVQVGDDKGYVQTEFLGTKRPNCLQRRYPNFYKNLNLDITEMYFWGRLYDQYTQGKSRIR